jgi:hypothetical protein
MRRGVDRKKAGALGNYFWPVSKILGLAPNSETLGPLFWLAPRAVLPTSRSYTCTGDGLQPLRKYIKAGEEPGEYSQSGEEVYFIERKGFLVKISRSLAC